MAKTAFKKAWRHRFSTRKAAADRAEIKTATHRANRRAGKRWVATGDYDGQAAPDARLNDRNVI